MTQTVTSPQQLVDDVRSFLQAADQTNTERLRELASAYAAACQDANQRLRRCGEFLHRGLRGEAIQFAEVEPILLDLVAVLDFPERAQWDEVVNLYELPAPPPLRLDVAEALNRAFTEQAPLDHLLKQHRRLALARAPLPERLNILRRLAEVDPNNPVWRDDIAELEKARLRLLQQDVEKALRAKDNALLQGLYSEVMSWPAAQQALPIDQMNRLTSAVTAHAAGQRRQALQQKATQIHDAHGAMDVAQLRIFAEEWQTMVAEANLGTQDTLVRGVQPALQWLAKQEKRQTQETDYQEALAALQRALYSEKRPLRLEKLRELVAAFPQGLSKEMNVKVDQRLEELDASRRRREWLILALVLFLGAAGLIGLIVFLMNQ